MINEMDKYIKNRSKVVSREFGLGEIVGKFTMYDGIDDYIGVFYFDDQIVRYFCIKHVNDIRLLSSKITITEALKLMDEKLADHSILNNFSEMNVRFGDKDVLFLVRRIVELFRKNSLSEEEKRLLHSSVDSLVQEIEQVYKVDNNCARGMVSDYMKSA